MFLQLFHSQNEIDLDLQVAKYAHLTLITKHFYWSVYEMKGTN